MNVSSIVSSTSTKKASSPAFKGRANKIVNPAQMQNMKAFLNTHSNKISQAGAAVLNSLIKVFSYAQYVKIKAVNTFKQYFAKQKASPGSRKFIDFSFKISNKLNKAAYNSRKKINNVAYKTGITNSFIKFKMKPLLKSKPVPKA